MLNHLIVKQGESLHAIQIRPISRKNISTTTFHYPFYFNRISSEKPMELWCGRSFVRDKCKRETFELFLPRTKYLPPLTSSIIIRGILLRRGICLPIYSVGRIHKIHLKCHVLIASPCGSCLVEPDTIVSVQTFMLGPY